MTDEKLVTIRKAPNGWTIDCHVCGRFSMIETVSHFDALDRVAEHFEQEHRSYMHPNNGRMFGNWIRHRMDADQTVIYKEGRASE